LSSGGIEADHVDALAGRGELAPRGIEQGGISRIDSSCPVQNDMAVAKRLFGESSRTCLGASIPKVTRPDIVWPSPITVEESCKPHKSFIDVSLIRPIIVLPYPE
jgi:hypothetical protein